MIQGASASPRGSNCEIDSCVCRAMLIPCPAALHVRSRVLVVPRSSMIEVWWWNSDPVDSAARPARVNSQVVSPRVPASHTRTCNETQKQNPCSALRRT